MNSSDLLWKSEMHLRRDKSGDAVGRPSWESSFLGHCGAKFSVENGGSAPRKKKERKASVSTGPTTTIQHMKSSLNSVSTCLKVVDTRAVYQTKWFNPGKFARVRPRFFNELQTENYAPFGT